MRVLINRTALTLAGLAVLALSGAAATSGGHRVVASGLRRLEEAGPHAVVLTGGLGVVVGMCLLAAQSPRSASRRLRLPAPGCSLDSRAVRRAVRVLCSAVPGVTRARCRLTRHGDGLKLSVSLVLSCAAHPDDVLSEFSDRVLPQITASLAPRRLRTCVRLTVRRTRSRRAV
ncbi:hypothetical protein ABZ615_18395 [Streptomyces sp. NPDC007325]|uniref:hypothetical protein n=1 Tax=Streptomyces sp. NPDC007325 TaxID=3154588 RepID=UPI0033C413B8